MHFNTLGFVAATIAALSQTGAANIGQGTRLLGKIAGEVGTTGWNVGLHVSDKRDLDGLPRRAPQGANPFPGVSDVEYERCFNDAVAAVITATSPAGDGMYRPSDGRRMLLLMDDLSDPIRRGAGFVHEPGERARRHRRLRCPLRFCLSAVLWSYARRVQRDCFRPAVGRLGCCLHDWARPEGLGVGVA